MLSLSHHNCNHKYLGIVIPSTRMGELCPGLRYCAPQSWAPIKCYIAAAMLSEYYEPSPAPVPPLRILSYPYISPSEGLPKMPLTTDHPLWSGMPCNGFSPAPSLTLATRALGFPCRRVTHPGINGVLVRLTPEDGWIG